MQAWEVKHATYYKYYSNSEVLPEVTCSIDTIPHGTRGIVGIYACSVYSLCISLYIADRVKAVT